MWRCVLQFVCIANMNGGPFRSGQWHQLKKDAAKRFVELHTPTSDEFQEVTGRFAKAMHHDISTEAGMESLFLNIQNLNLAQRWGSESS